MKDRQLLLAIMAQLEREKTVSIPQLSTLLGVDEQLVYDALEILVFAYDAASVRLDLHDSYATLQTHGTDRLLRLTAPEADALLDALTTAGFSADDELIGALLRTKTMLGGAESAPKPRLMIVTESASSDVAQALAAACEDVEHPVLEIAYHGTDDDAPQTRRIEPLRIFSEDGHRYLQAYCRMSKDWRSFRIDRVTSVRVLDERFSPRTGAPRPSIALGSGTQARIRLNAGCPLPSWRDLRVSSTADDGSRIVSVPWTGSSWLPKHVVSLMGEALPLEPQALVDACEAYAKSLIDQ
ncbi:MAG: WYL domain-containing protein [Coriobacteriales bacterium]